MVIGVTGASGFIGQRVVDLALTRGHEIVAFTRYPHRTMAGCEMRPFSLTAPPDLRGCEAVIHLAGEPIVGLWTPAKKRRIVASRQLGTRRVVEAINRAATPPEVFLSGSAIGFYGDGGEAELTEAAPSGGGFFPETVRGWEAEAQLAAGPRVVLLRSSVVLGRGGGALRLLAPVFRAGLGGRLGSGRQWMSWIHWQDEARLALFAIEDMNIDGPLNATAPWPVRNSEFTRSLASAMRRPALFHVPAWILRLLGDFSGELLDSKRVVPALATAHGFRFNFPELDVALQDLLP